MKLIAAKASDQGYTSHILPFSGKELPKAYLNLCPELADHPLPEAEEWTTLLHGKERYLLVSFDESAHQKKIADGFRLFAVKAKKHLGDRPFLHSDGLGQHAEPALRGMAMAAYVIGMHKEKTRKEQNPKAPTLAIEGIDESIVQEAAARAEVQMRVMHLVDLPPCDKTPAILGDWALASARRYGFDCEVWDSKKMNHMGMHAVIAVGKGSNNPPVFIISRYRGRTEDQKVDLALVGKGVTFDTGGISIKPSENLHYMKCDMAGGAAMLGAIEIAARLKLPLNITAVVPAAENAVDAASLLPGDVIHSYSGKTIEIINTDAEGRLILADALSWTVQNEKPERIIDFATLTGASVRALGKEAASLYTDDESLRDTLMSAGYQTGEKMWPMPLWDDYKSHLNSDVADVSNLSQSPTAGSIAAAKFLQVFTAEHPSWAHVDMPGQSFGDSPFSKMKSATGYGVQLLLEVMRTLS